MQKYRIFAGLGGGFGGIQQVEVRSFLTAEEATNYAFSCACDEYETYDGMHGLMSWEEAREEAEQQFSTGDEDDDDYDSEIEYRAEQIYNDSRDSWLEYYAESVTDEELSILPIKEVDF